MAMSWELPGFVRYSRQDLVVGTTANSNSVKQTGEARQRFSLAASQTGWDTRTIEHSEWSSNHLAIDILVTLLSKLFINLVVPSYACCTASFFRRQLEEVAAFLVLFPTRPLPPCRLSQRVRPRYHCQAIRRLCLCRLSALGSALCVHLRLNLPTPPTVEPKPPTKSPFPSLPTPSPTPPVTSLAVSPTPLVTPPRALPGRPPPPGREPVTLLPTPSTVDPTPLPAPETVFPTPPPAPEAAPFKLPFPSAPVVSPTVLLAPAVALDTVFPTLSVALPTVLPAGPPIVFPVIYLA